MKNITSTPPTELLVTDEKRRRELKKKSIHLPRINLTTRQLYDLELLLNGGFSPLQGFMSEEDYAGVIERMHLSGGAFWPMPVVLDVPPEVSAKKGSELLLCDQFGKPLAIFSVASVYSPDKQREARLVFGTTDPLHPGVQYLFEHMHNVYLGGAIEGLSYADTHDFRDFRLTPRQLRLFFKNSGWERIIGFQTRNPLHRAHFELIRRAARDHDAHVLIHPVVGLTKEGDIDYLTRVRCYQKLHEGYARDFTKLALLPLAMRMGGPREALWHAIIRKNYGCTHFIVGRDHAGPGKNSRGKPFYGPYEAQELASKYAEELGIIIVPFKEMSYVEELDAYLPENEIKPSHTVRAISGTEVRRMLVENEPIPAWFSFPEIVEELRASAERQKRQRGYTIFFTGLSGAGKSTVAQVLRGLLLELQNREITLLDGDIIRQHLSKGLGFSREDRDINIERIGFVASEIVKHGGIAICSAIAPYRTAREKNRQLIEQYGSYIEVYVATPLDICRARDVKGLYRKADAGLLKNFTGIDDPYEEPEKAEVVLDTTKKSPRESAEEIIAFLREHQLLDRA